MTELSDKSMGALTALIDCLTREDEMLSFLLAACEDQTEALKSNNSKNVETAVSKVSNLLNGISAMEEERMRCKEILDAELGLDPDAPLKDLLPYISSESWEKVNALSEGMSAKAEQLKSVNKLNRIMTRQVLDYSTMMLTMLNPRKNLTYGATGLDQGITQPGKSLLNKKI